MPTLKEMKAMKAKKATEMASTECHEQNKLVEETKHAVDAEPCVDINLLSRKDKRKLADMLVEDFGTLMEEVGLNREDAKEYLPDELKKKEKKAPKSKKKAPFKDWREAACKEDLLCLKRADLEKICKDASIPTSLANKSVLADRVWGIEHPDEAPVIKKGKRGRPAKKVVEEESVDDSSGSEGEEKDAQNPANESGGGEKTVSTEGGCMTPQMSSEEVRFSGDKLDANGSDVYIRYKGTDFIVTAGDDVDYVGKLDGDTLRRNEFAEEFMVLLS